jgi:hypothetical protein
MGESGDLMGIFSALGSLGGALSGAAAGAAGGLVKTTASVAQVGTQAAFMTSGTALREFGSVLEMGDDSNGKSIFGAAGAALRHGGDMLHAGAQAVKDSDFSGSISNMVSSPVGGGADLKQLLHACGFVKPASMAAMGTETGISAPAPAMESAVAHDPHHADFNLVQMPICNFGGGGGAVGQVAQR